MKIQCCFRIVINIFFSLIFVAKISAMPTADSSMTSTIPLQESTNEIQNNSQPVEVVPVAIQTLAIPVPIQPQEQSSQVESKKEALQPIKITQQEIDQLNNQLHEINDTKSSLKKILLQIDDEVGKSKIIAAEASKRSMDILGQKTDDAAKFIVDEITKSSESLKKIQSDISQSLSKTFQEGIDKIQATMKAMNESITLLKARGIDLQVAQTVTTTNSAFSKKSSFRNWFTTSKSGVKKQDDETFIHYLFHRMADLATGAIQIIYQVVGRIKEAVFGRPKTELSPSQVIPLTPKKTAAETSAAAGNFSACLETFKKNISEVELQYNTFVNEQEKINMNIEAIQQTLTSNENLKENLFVLDIMAVEQKPVWQKTLEVFFSQTIDYMRFFTVLFVSKIQFFYSNYIKKLFYKITSDVVKQEKKEENTVPESSKVSDLSSK